MTKNLQRISDKIIYFYRERYEENLSSIKLQTLCYYAQGLYMVKKNKPLFEEDFYAWENGPILEELYMENKELEWRTIDKEINQIEYLKDEDDILFQIVSTFGSYDGAALSSMTKEGSPWIKVSKKYQVDVFILKKDILISKESIFEYFKKESIFEYFKEERK